MAEGLYLCLGLEALPQRISGSLHNCFSPSLAAGHLQEVVIAASGDILPIATDSAVKFVENAVILVQVAQLQHRTGAKWSSHMKCFEAKSLG